MVRELKGTNMTEFQPGDVVSYTDKSTGIVRIVGIDEQGILVGGAWRNPAHLTLVSRPKSLGRVLYDASKEGWRCFDKWEDISEDTKQDYEQMAQAVVDALEEK
jgi:hypothetical protein